jgi:hypothetical protein
LSESLKATPAKAVVDPTRLSTRVDTQPLPTSHLWTSAEVSSWIEVEPTAERETFGQRVVGGTDR